DDLRCVRLLGSELGADDLDLIHGPSFSHCMPCRNAWISATIASAMDSGVRPPRLKPTGARKRCRRRCESGPSSASSFSRLAGGPRSPTYGSEVALNVRRYSTSDGR